MNRRFRLPSAALLAALLLLPRLAPAQTLTRYDAQPGSKVKLEGTSTIHDWTMEGQIIGGAFEADPAFQLGPDLKPGKVNAKAAVSIPVRTIKSGKNSMDSVMQQAMKQADFPKIEYRLTELTFKAAPTPPATAYQFDSSGELTVAGVTNKVSFPVTMEKGEGTKLKISGGTPIKMTQYGVTPPAPALAAGLIKTGDEVKLSFEWNVGVRAAEKAQ